MTLLTIGGESRLNITEVDEKIKWNSISDDFELSINITKNIWSLVAGTYQPSGVVLYFNGTQNSSGTVMAPTSYSLELLNNITLTTSRVKLYVLSFWNSVLPFSKILQLNGRTIIERERAVYFFHFGLVRSERIYNWVDQSDYFHLNTSMVLS